MRYRVLHPNESFEDRFVKTLASFPGHDQDAVIGAIAALAEDPRPPGYLKLTPAEKIRHRYAYYRIRVGQYRVFYDIVDGGKKVYILAVKRRNEKTYT